MAPEQAQGAAVDQRADLFALGSTMYFMATGQAPFRGGSGLAVIRQVSDVEPTPIRDVEPDIPLWLEGIIRKLHAKDPAQRFQSAAEVASLLEQCLAHVQQPAHQPLPVQAVELGKRLAEPKQRSGIWKLGAVLGVVCVALLAMASLIHPWMSKAKPSADAVIESVNFDEAFQTESNQVRDRLDNLRDAFSVPAASEAGADETLANARNRLELLNRDLGSVTAAGADPARIEMDNIRRRLELLRKDLGSGNE